jgi:hypothetical protein
MDGRGRFAAALTAALLCPLGATGTAQAAHFTALPQALFVQSGAGPFEWTFASDDPADPAGPVAYKLSTEEAWHRCVADGAASLSDLPEGRYTVTIADDPQPCSPDIPTVLGPPTATEISELVVDGTPPVIDEPLVTIGPLNVTLSIPRVIDPLAGVQSVTWDAGDGSAVGQTRRFTHEYAAGTWTATVTVVDRAGNSASRSVVVTVPPRAIVPRLTRPAPTPVPRPVPPTPVHDTTAPTFNVTQIGRRILAQRALRVSVALAPLERAHLSASATIRIGRARYALQRAFSPLGPRVNVQLTTPPPIQLNLAASARVRRAVRAALARHRAVRADVTVVASDAIGNKRSLTRTVRVVG